jgi:hypothetical protein
MRFKYRLLVALAFLTLGMTLTTTASAEAYGVWGGRNWDSGTGEVSYGDPESGGGTNSMAFTYSSSRAPLEERSLFVRRSPILRPSVMFALAAARWGLRLW